MKNFSASLRSLFVVATVAFTFTACNKNEIIPTNTEQEQSIAAEENCTVSFFATGGTSLGYTPKLQPVSSGEAKYNGGSDCDYFVGFAANNYDRIVVADLDDAPAAAQIRSLITDPRTFTGGGFGNSLGLGGRSADTREYVILGAFRSNNYLSGFASARGTTVRALLAKHLRMGLL